MSDKKNIIVYFLANSINAAIPFLLLPILTRYLSPSQYGEVAIFLSLVAALGAFVGLNSVGASSRVYFDNLDSKLKSRYNNSCVIILFISSFVVLLGLLLSNSIISEQINLSAKYIYIALLVSVSNYILQFRLVSFQVRKRAVKYGFFQISNSMLNCIISLIFVIYFGFGEYGRILGISISIFLISTIAIVSLCREKILDFRLGFNLLDCKDALLFGIPLVPHVFGGFLLASADRFVIAKYFTTSSAGVYMVALQISMVFAIVFDALNKALMPWLFRKLSDGFSDDKYFIVKMTYLGFLVFIIIAIFASWLFPYIIPYLLGEDFIIPNDILVWLFFAQVFGGMYLAFTNYIFYSKQTKKLAYVTIVSGSVNVLLLLLLVPTLQLKGAAISFFIAKLLQFVFTWYAANSCYKMPWFGIPIFK